MAQRFALVIALLSIGPTLLACGQKPPPEAPGQASAAPETEPAGAPQRPSVTAEACEAGGGLVVGDIGDGAIHRPEYRCANGAAPTAGIQAAGGGPIAIEGSVCCPK